MSACICLASKRFLKVQYILDTRLQVRRVLSSASHSLTAIALLGAPCRRPSVCGLDEGGAGIGFRCTLARAERPGHQLPPAPDAPRAQAEDR